MAGDRIERGAPVATARQRAVLPSRVVATAAVFLRPERERSLRLGHPWVLSGSVERVEGDPAPGACVRVRSSRGETLATGDYDPDSQIRVRVTRFGAEEDPDERFLDERIASGLRWRAAHPLLRETDALRLVHAEADGLPGLTVDRYGDLLVVRAATPAMLARRERLAKLLAEATGARGAWLRGEGPDDALGSGRLLFGEVPDAPIWIHERGRRYAVDLRRGQKTGFYLDQRDSRDLFAQLATGARALDLFCYSGGFAAAAQQGGARAVVAVDTSRPALALLASNAPGAEAIAEDAGAYLRRETRRFDLVALDPPPFARRKRDVAQAARAYKDLHLHALRVAAPGAHLLTFSCSHHVDLDLFRKIVFGAALDAGAEVQILRVLGAPPDHPVDLRHPQGEYLKGLLLRVGRPPG
jgi:23S rRNA (cytosine1962-C5)-methyltransferase